MTTMHAPRVSTCLPIPESPEPTRMNRQRVEAIRKSCPPKRRQQPIACRTANRREGQDSLGRTESRPSTGGRDAPLRRLPRGGRGPSPQGALGAPLRVLTKKPESFARIIFPETIDWPRANLPPRVLMSDGQDLRRGGFPPGTNSVESSGPNGEEQTAPSAHRTRARLIFRTVHVSHPAPHFPGKK